MKPTLQAIALFVCAFLFCGAAAVSQEIYATLTGAVTDATGGVVAGASATIHNNETNTDLRTVATDTSGNFTVTNLPAGTYTVTVKNAGFRTFAAENVSLHVAEKRTIDVQLQPGQVTETVTVMETTTPVQTSSSAQAGTITGTQVRELELNNRNFQQLVTLQPGVVSGFGPVINFGISNTTNVVVNGARNTANNWTVDGSDINDSGSNGTLLNVPSVDAIQEFTLGRSNYDAQYGRSGGGQVLVGTKSGTSQFHGDAYEFVRNDFFNANDFFANSAGRARPVLRYNDFGFTIGGPIFVPKIYKKSESKTFFFWSEEWRKTHQPSTLIATVPTAAELGGTFAGNLTALPAPGGCITYNAAANTSQINASCFSHNAQAYLTNIYSKFPANAANGQYISNVVGLNNYRQDLVRLDQNITEKVHLFGRFIQDIVPTTEPGGLFAGEPLPGISSTATNAPGKNVVGNMSWAISPTVVNEVAFNYSWGAINSSMTGVFNSPAFVSALSGGVPYADPYNRIYGISISGFTGVAAPAAPYFERNIDKNVYDNFSKVLGNHTLRTGATVQWMQKTENGPVGPPSFSFSAFSGLPGSAFANFLLGNASSFSQASKDTIPHLNYYNLEAYVQDDWKVTPTLTLNLGVRYSFFPAPSDSNNTLNNFDPLLFNPAAVPLINPVTGNFVAGQSLIPANYVNGIIFPTGAACANAQKFAPVTCSPFGSTVNPNSNNNWGPRFGFAWDPYGNGKTSIRGGYGIFYDRTLNGLWEQNAFTEPPLVQSTTITYTTYDSFDHPLAGTTKVPLGPAHFDTSGSPAFKVPNYQDWNFSIEHEILPNTVFQIA
ncbi:MAG: carboxypeptidase regulatory-like domain-containing protein, partial [Acidobacteriaceae bacterium]|nr:carboxypeptidase regulatory-like domain-containing protein [Acidobacteriaceae bacterium]